MSTTEIVLLVCVGILAVVIVAMLVTAMRRRKLRRRFQDEYDRTIDQTGSRRKADQELMARTRRHDELEVVPLSRLAREEFRSRWDNTQAQFVDEPQAAMIEADQLVKQVMKQRGYPTESFDQQTADLSVEHADVLDNYRKANDITDANKRGRASTEDLRQAMVHYRSLFDSLLSDDHDREDTRR